MHDCAKADGHLLAWPTHMIEKDLNVVGSLSVMPMVMIWLDTTKTQVRDTLFLRDYLEGTMANGSRVFCVPCVEGSPLTQVLRKSELGYLNIGNFNLHLKGL